MSIAENKKLDYEIYKYTSFSSSYSPENIREDQPDNQASRWSTDSNTQTAQYLTLKLPRPAIVREILFGKYERPHVCNLKKFKILGGTEDTCNILLLEAGLKNDSTPEKFELKHHTSSGELLPIRYIQINPLFSWGTGFNFSIWYIELLGNDDPMFVNSVLRSYNIEREAEIVRLCLKYFRQQGYDQAFKALQHQTNVQLEHPMMHELYQTLVVEGDFKRAEEHMEKLVNDGVVDDYIQNVPYTVAWKQITTGDALRPGKRGGHQLVMDTKKRVMYLYGGWNGFEDLSDMWMFDLQTSKWSLIHEKSELVGGPNPRACHKMVLDTETSQIFMLGRYIESRCRGNEKIRSDFYLFDTETRTWLLICENTGDFGGPGLIFDHQMCIDSERRVIYVFGGRILSSDPNELEQEQKYSGLYAYDISDNVWTLLFSDVAAAGPETRTIKSRITHSMVYHEKMQKLIIFGGQRDKQNLTDYIEYDVVNDNLTIAEHAGTDGPNSRLNLPQPGLTTRVTIDPDHNEIYVLTSLSKDKVHQDMKLNALWVYNIKKNFWSCIYRSDESEGSGKQNLSPCPRYAHQLVYDRVERVHYLFGGNPGMQSESKERLDDFWALNLCKPSTRESVLRQCRYMIRTQQYEVLTRIDPVLGLQYLQTELYKVIDRNDQEHLRHFHKLATLLFKMPEQEVDTPMTTPQKSPQYLDESSSSTGVSSMSSDDLYQYNVEQLANKSVVNEQQCNRYMLYNRLLQFLPDKLCQPKTNLTDFILI